MQLKAEGKVKNTLFIGLAVLLVAFSGGKACDAANVDDIVYEIKVNTPQVQEVKSQAQLEADYYKKRVEVAKKAGEAAALQMKQSYKIIDTPNYPAAYYFYLEDLVAIADKGLAPERANLFRDLELMNSNDVYMYYDSNDDYRL